MSSPSLDNQENTQLSLVGSTATFTSGFSIPNNSLWIVGIGTTHTANAGVPSISSITTPKLTFVKVAELFQANVSGQFGNNDFASSIWGAANFSGSSVVTPTMTVKYAVSPAGGSSYEGLNISGTHAGAPLDSSGGTFMAQALGNVVVATATTLQPDDLLMYFAFCDQAAGNTHPPSGWTDVSGPHSSPNSYVAQKSVSSIQTGLTAAAGGRADSWAQTFIVAFTSDIGGHVLGLCGTIPLPT